MAKQKNSTKPVVRDPISAYAQELVPGHAAICRKLRSIIDTALPQATTSKIWHGSPVWFVGENPVVAYSVKAGAVSLLFWNGRSWNDAALTPVGKFRAAEKRYNAASDVDLAALDRWLRHAGTDVFDSVGMIRAARAKGSCAPKA